MEESNQYPHERDNFPDSRLEAQDITAWSLASDDELIQALNRNADLPFPSEAFTVFCKEHRRHVWDASEFARRFLGS